MALQAAKESITLLRNDDNILPLSPTSTLRVALVGPLANSSSVMEGAKPDYDAKHIVGVLEGLTALASSSTIEYSSGLLSVKDNNTLTKEYEQAVAIASQADVAIVVVGIDASVEKEALDRTDVLLPGAQQQLILDIATNRAAAGHTKQGGMVVVLINGGPISCDWLRTSTLLPIAVVEAFEGGQEAGSALGATLYGFNNPSGVLPYSLYYENATVESVVPFTQFDMRPEGSYPGRTYRFSVAPTLWEFGHGLSYTTFQLTWSNKDDDDGQKRAVHDVHDVQRVHRPGIQHMVQVTNTGAVAGAKVVHAFVTRRSNERHVALKAPSPPIKSLYGMKKVYLNPGETKTVVFSTKSMSGSKPFGTTLRNGSVVLVPGRVTITVGVGKERIEQEFTMVGEEMFLL